MKTYRVIASEIVYSYCYIEAENEQEALALADANDNIENWETYEIGDYIIEKAEIVESKNV